jgi:hypothetical protein
MSFNMLSHADKSLPFQDSDALYQFMPGLEEYLAVSQSLCARELCADCAGADSATRAAACGGRPRGPCSW